MDRISAINDDPSMPLDSDSSNNDDSGNILMDFDSSSVQSQQVHCLNCGTNVSQRRSHSVTLTDVLSVFSQWTAPQMVESGSIVCHPCWTLALNESRSQPQPSTSAGRNRHLCGCCRSSLSRVRYHVLRPNNDNQIRQIITNWILPQQYMGGLQPVRGRCLVEAGWRGRVWALAQRHAVFPGDVVPLVLPLELPPHHLPHHDKLFALLFSDYTNTVVTGLGVLCEVFEAGNEEGEPHLAFNLKSRAIARVQADIKGLPLSMFATLELVEVEVLPEYCLQEPLRHVRLHSLDARRHTKNEVVRERLSRLEAAVTSWPRFLLQRGDYNQLRNKVHNYFAPFTNMRGPAEATALSYWVCSNVWARGRDRLRLLREQDATARIHHALALVDTRGVARCVRCGADVTRLRHAFSMSSQGLRANYTNPGGHVHDVVTVCSVRSARCSGAASSEFSWFPGYTWTVLVCARCNSHLGWRFDAMSSSLRPKRFYGLSRGLIEPSLSQNSDDEDDHV